MDENSRLHIYSFQIPHIELVPSCRLWHFWILILSFSSFNVLLGFISHANLTASLPFLHLNHGWMCSSKGQPPSSTNNVQKCPHICLHPWIRPFDLWSFNELRIHQFYMRKVYQMVCYHGDTLFPPCLLIYGFHTRAVALIWPQWFNWAPHITASCVIQSHDHSFRALCRGHGLTIRWDRSMKVLDSNTISVMDI